MFLTPQHIQHPGAPRRPRILHCISHHRTLSNNRSNSRVARTRLAARTHPVPRTEVLTRRETGQAIRRPGVVVCTWHAADQRSCSCPGQETSASRRGEPTHGGWLAARKAGRAQRRARTVRPTYTSCHARKRGRAQRLGNADSAPNVSFPLACRTTGPTGPTWDMQDIRSTFGLEFSLCACVCVW